MQPVAQWHTMSHHSTTDEINTTLLSTLLSSPIRNADDVMVYVRSNDASHDILKQALVACTCMEHRGASSADNISGDGAGSLSTIARLMTSFTARIPNSCLLPVCMLDSNDSKTSEFGHCLCK